MTQVEKIIQKAILIYCLLNGLSSIAAFVHLLSIPNEASSLIILGIQARNMVVLIMSAILITATLITMANAFFVWLCPEKTVDIFRNFSNQKKWLKVIFMSSVIIFLASLVINISPRLLRFPLAIFIRIQPLLVWTVIVTGYNILGLSFLLLDRNFEFLKKIDEFTRILFTEKNIFGFVVFAGILMNIVALIPLLASGYYYDDVLKSMIKGTAGMNGWGLDGYLMWALNSFISRMRLYPLVELLFPIYWFFSYPVYMLKMVYLIGTVTASTVFFFLIRKVSNSNWFGLLGLFLVPIFIQFRSYHDPILAYHLLLQTTLVLLALSLFFYYSYIQTGFRYKYMHVISIVLYVVSLLTYEISIPYILLFVVIAINSRDIKSTIKYLLPHFICVVGTVLITFLMRVYAANNHIAVESAYQIHFNLFKSFKTWGYQIGSTFPFSFAYFNNPYGIPRALSSLTWVDLIAFAIYFFLIMFVISRIGPVHNKLKLFSLSVLLIVLPGSLLSLSEKYQAEIGPGNGHLAVFHQYFGGILLILLFITWIKEHVSTVSLVVNWVGGRILNIPIGKYLYIVAIGFLACLYIINFKLNAYTVESLNRDWYYDRSILEEALSSGIMDKIPSGSIIIYDKSPYYPPDLFYQYTQKYFQLVKFEDYVPAAIRVDSHTEIYILEYKAINNAQGYVLIEKIDPTNLPIIQSHIEITDARIFLINKNGLYTHFQNFIFGNKEPENTIKASILFSNAHPIPGVFRENDNFEVIAKNAAEIQIISTEKTEMEFFSIQSENRRPFIISEVHLEALKSK